MSVGPSPNSFSEPKDPVGRGKGVCRVLPGVFFGCVPVRIVETEGSGQHREQGLGGGMEAMVM